MINSINSTNQNKINFKQNLSEPSQQQGKLREFNDYFIRDIKKSLPASAVIGAVWTLFDIRKGKVNKLNALISNIALFTTANVIFSAVESLFRINRKNPD